MLLHTLGLCYGCSCSSRYSSDAVAVVGKILVSVMLLDTSHTVLVSVAMFSYAAKYVRITATVKITVTVIDTGGCHFSNSCRRS